MRTAPRPPLSARRPRFRRANDSPNFRVTDNDIEIIRHVAENRFLRSTHIAALIGRSQDRTNDRLCHLFHAGYIDRPRAQLDYYPTAGSAPIVYALADRGARLLKERLFLEIPSLERSRRNREATRPFIEHQLKVIDFKIAMRQGIERAGHRFVDSRSASSAFAMRVSVAHHGARREIGLAPDLAFSVELASGARRNYFVEIDRGTMPVTRATISQTSIERKLLGYLAAHSSRTCERMFKWKAWRVLIVTTDRSRVEAMIAVAASIVSRDASGRALFLFASHDEIRDPHPLSAHWHDTEKRLRSVL